MDRRVQATQQKLVHALRALMQRYPWRSITVATICQHTEISRSTFYKHFSSKEELMLLSLDYLANELAPADTRRGLNESGTLKFVPALLQHIKEHREILTQNLDTADASTIMRNLQKTAIGLVNKEIQESRYANDVDRNKLVFICGGLFALVQQWVEDDCKQAVNSLVAAIDAQLTSALQDQA